MSNISIWNLIALSGIACVIVAIVGSGINIPMFKIKGILSLRQRFLLGALGVLLFGGGLVAEHRSLSPESEGGAANAPVTQDPSINVSAPDNPPKQIGADPRKISITSPTRGQRVAVYEFVRGQAPRGTRQIWIIVHPLQTRVCWAQGPGTVDADGTWQIMGQFGEEGDQDTNKPYDVRAIANPRLSGDAPLETGSVPCGLDAQFHSNSVDVVRR